MAYVDIPLSNFIGEKKELLDMLYAVPDKTVAEHRNDYELVLNLPTNENYKPTRDHTPSVLWNDEFEPIFGTKNVCIYDPYYLLYLKLIDHIIEKFEEDGIFKYCYQSKDDEEVVCCSELTVKEDVKDFLAHIIQTVPCTLYDIKENLGLN